MMKKNNCKIINLKEKETASKKAITYYSVFVILIALLMLLNLSSDMKKEFELSTSSNSTGTGVAFEPALALSRGTYKIQVGTSGYDSKTKFKLVSPQDGTIYESSLSETQTFIVDLKKDVMGLQLVTDNGGTGTPIQLTKAVISRNIPLYTDTVMLTILMILLLAFLGYVRFKPEVFNGDATALVIIFGAALIASYPLFTSYLYYGHDLTFHLWRIEGIKDGLLSGQFPVRIHPTHNNGYGYITASVYPELFLYFPAILRILGVTLPTAYKTFLFAMNLATGLIMYYSYKNITGSKYGAVLASVIYTLATWRIINAYHRAAIGEALAMTFFPLAVWGLYNVIKGDKKKWAVLAVGFTCIFQVHVISTVLTAIFSIIVCLFFLKDIFGPQKRYLSILKALCLALLLNLWYLVPFMKYYFSLDMAIRQPVINKEFFANAIIPAEFFNVFNTSFGYSLLLPSGIKGNMSLSLGVGVTVCMIIGLLYFTFRRKDNRIENEKFMGITFFYGILLVFAATSLFPWELIQQNALINKFAGLVRMPWRFLSLASPLITIVAVMVIVSYTKNDNYKKPIIFFVCLISAISMVQFGTAFTTETSTYNQKCRAITADGSLGWDKEYVVRGTNLNKLKANEYSSSEGVTVNNFEKNGTNIKLNISNTSNGSIEVPLLYYPGYNAVDENGKKLTISSGTGNVMRVSFDSTTQSEIKIKYAGFISFKFATLLSILTLLALIFYPYYERRRK